MKNEKKFEQIPQNGGLLIGQSITLGVAEKKHRLEKPKLWFVALAGIFGSVFGVVSMFEIRCNYFQIGAIALAAAFISSLVFSTKKRLIPSLLLCCVLFLCIFALPHYELEMGFKYFVNQIISTASLKSYGIVKLYIPRKVDEYACATVFMSAFAALTSFLVCFAVIAQKSFALSLIFTFPLIEIGLIFGIAPDYKAFALLLSFWLAAVALCNSSYQKYVGTNAGDFVRKGNTFIPKFGMKKRVDASSALCMLLLTFAVFTVSSVAVAAFDIKRSDSVNELRYTLKHDILNMSFDDIKNRITNNSQKTDYADVRTGDLEFTDSDMLMLKFSQKSNNNIYFKGYVGSVYNSSGWTEFDNDTLAELSALSEEFENVCYPQDMLWHYLRINHPDLSSTSVTVDVINAGSDYCYMPYAAMPYTSTRYYADNNAFVNSVVIGESNASASYSYDFLSTDFEQLLLWYCNSSNGGSSARLQSEKYDAFVSENYLSVPHDADLISLYKDVPFANIVERYRSGEADIYKTLCDIRTYIQSQTSYSLSPGDVPSDVDPVYYFLKENHKGYCVHYASTGAILARMAGIPSRYCLGYVAKPSKFNLLNKQGSGYSFMLKDDSAHAWVEIYIDGLGWIPFEFTDGYSQSNEDTSHQTTSVTTKTTTRGSASSFSATNTTTFKSGTVSAAALHSKNSAKTRAQRTVLTVIALVLIITALCVMIILRSRKVALLRLSKSMRTRSDSQNAINAYRYIVALLEFGGVSVEGRTPLEYAMFAEDKCGFFKPGQLILACNFAMKAAFGSMRLSAEESNEVKKLSRTVAKSVYASSSHIDRLKMKYIHRLI